MANTIGTENGMKVTEQQFLDALEHIRYAKQCAGDEKLTSRVREACNLAWAALDRLRSGFVRDGKIELLDPFEEFCEQTSSSNESFLKITVRGSDWYVHRDAARIVWDAAQKAKGRD